MSTTTPLGPGTVKVGGTSGVSFECEVVGAAITHDYSKSDSKTKLCGTVSGGSVTRTDGFTAELENDLSATGLYDYLQKHDTAEQEFEFTPNTAGGAKWVGKVTLTLPDEVGASEFGAPMAGKIAWTAADTGKFTFTPATAATVPAAS